MGSLSFAYPNATVSEVVFTRSFLQRAQKATSSLHLLNKNERAKLIQAYGNTDLMFQHLDEKVYFLPTRDLNTAKYWLQQNIRFGDNFSFFMISSQPNCHIDYCVRIDNNIDTTPIQITQSVGGVVGYRIETSDNSLWYVSSLEQAAISISRDIFSCQCNEHICDHAPLIKELPQHLSTMVPTYTVPMQWEALPLQEKP